MSEEKFNSSQFESAKKELEDLIVNNLAHYIRDENMPNVSSSDRMKCYDIIYKFSDNGFGKDLLKYHNDKVTECVNECYEKMKDLTGFDFMDSLILYTTRLNALIFYMSKTFKYISMNYLKATHDKNYVRVYKENDVSEFSMVIYKKNFFDKLETKLLAILNDPKILVEIERNLECRKKILKIMRIIFDMEIIKPIIIKKSNTYFGWKVYSYDYNNNVPSERLKKYEDFCKKIGLNAKDLNYLENYNLSELI